MIVKLSLNSDAVCLNSVTHDSRSTTHVALLYTHMHIHRTGAVLYVCVHKKCCVYPRRTHTVKEPSYENASQPNQQKSKMVWYTAKVCFTAQSIPSMSISWNDWTSTLTTCHPLNFLSIGSKHTHARTHTLTLSLTNTRTHTDTNKHTAERVKARKPRVIYTQR